MVDAPVIPAAGAATPMAPGTQPRLEAAPATAAAPAEAVTQLQEQLQEQLTLQGSPTAATQATQQQPLLPQALMAAR